MDSFYKVSFTEADNSVGGVFRVSERQNPETELIRQILNFEKDSYFAAGKLAVIELVQKA